DVPSGGHLDAFVRAHGIGTCSGALARDHSRLQVAARDGCWLRRPGAAKTHSCGNAHQCRFGYEDCHVYCGDAAVVTAPLGRILGETRMTSRRDFLKCAVVAGASGSPYGRKLDLHEDAVVRYCGSAVAIMGFEYAERDRPISVYADRCFRVDEPPPTAGH